MRGAGVALLVCAAAIAGWPFALHEIRGDDVYAVLGPYGAATAVVMLGLWWLGRGDRHDAHVTRGLLVGAAVGVAMTAATYVAYAVVAAAVPSLARHVSDLYAAARSERLAPALAWTCVVMCAEELLWRGVLLDAATRRFGRGAAIAISLLTYTAVQIASGSWVVALAAAICGAIWTAERILARTIVAPLVSHAIWTITVIHLWPVTR